MESQLCFRLDLYKGKVIIEEKDQSNNKGTNKGNKQSFKNKQENRKNSMKRKRKTNKNNHNNNKAIFKMNFMKILNSSKTCSPAYKLLNSHQFTHIKQTTPNLLMALSKRNQGNFQIFSLWNSKSQEWKTLRKQQLWILVIRRSYLECKTSTLLTFHLKI